MQQSHKMGEMYNKDKDAGPRSSIKLCFYNQKLVFVDFELMKHTIQICKSSLKQSAVVNEPH